MVYSTGRAGTLILRRSGGIGRHSGFKIHREQSLVGSSPTFGTHINFLMQV